jgi:hypothetical protein
MADRRHVRVRLQRQAWPAWIIVPIAFAFADGTLCGSRRGADDRVPPAR